MPTLSHERGRRSAPAVFFLLALGLLVSGVQAGIDVSTAPGLLTDANSADLEPAPIPLMTVSEPGYYTIDHDLSGDG
jgi:hypothetical protein